MISDRPDDGALVTQADEYASLRTLIEADIARSGPCESTMVRAGLIQKLLRDYDALASTPANTAQVAPEIPAGVYYNREHANFYDAVSSKGKGQTFWEQWRDRRLEFPTAASPAQVASAPDRAGVERLMLAAKPFADCADEMDGTEDTPRADDEEWAKFRLIVKQYRELRSALAALSATPSREGEVERIRDAGKMADRHDLILLIERLCPNKPDSNFGHPIGSECEALADAILAALSATPSRANPENEQ